MLIIDVGTCGHVMAVTHITQIMNFCIRASLTSFSKTKHASGVQNFDIGIYTFTVRSRCIIKMLAGYRFDFNITILIGFYTILLNKKKRE